MDAGRPFPQEAGCCADSRGLIERPAFRGRPLTFARYRLRRDIVGYSANHSQNDAKERFGNGLQHLRMNRFQSVPPCGFVLRSDVFDAGGKALRCEFEFPLLRWASCIRLVLLGAAIWAALCFLACFLLACANLAISSFPRARRKRSMPFMRNSVSMWLRTMARRQKPRWLFWPSNLKCTNRLLPKSRPRFRARRSLSPLLLAKRFHGLPKKRARKKSCD